MKHEEQRQIADAVDKNAVGIEDPSGHCQHLQALGLRGRPFRRCKQAEIVRLAESADIVQPLLCLPRDGLVRLRPEKCFLARRN